MYQQRIYRDSVTSRHKLEVSYAQSDLFISSDRRLEKKSAKAILEKYYSQVAEYARLHPNFLTSLSPLEEDKNAPPIVQDMLHASRLSGIGPFASVAGAIACHTGEELLGCCREVIVENGGDIFLKIGEEKRLGIYLGQDRTIHIKVKPRPEGFGIASSSARMGHSLNFGQADLVTVISPFSALADALATSFSNRIKNAEDAGMILEEVGESSLVDGMVIGVEDKVFFQGEIELI